MTDKRKQIETLIDKVLSTLDPSGVNAKKYRNMFQVMSDKQFGDWINRFLADDKSNFRVDIQEFGDSSRVMKYENIEKAAGILGIPIFENVYMPHVSSNPDHPVRTKQPVLVGYLNMKRPQQFVNKKTGLTLSDTNRDEQTGIAKGESKGGTTTGIENELLVGLGGEVIISEFCGARGDNIAEYDNMLSSISEHGSVKLEECKTSAYDKPTLMQTDLYFKAMGIKTDIISESYYSIEKVRSAIYGINKVVQKTQ